MKPTDKPDSVHRPVLQQTGVTAITLGRGSPTRLDATYPPTRPAGRRLGLCGKPLGPWKAYLVLLRVEIARFTQVAFRALGGYRVSALRLNVWLTPVGTRLRGHPDRTPLVAKNNLTRLCCSDPHLAVESR